MLKEALAIPDSLNCDFELAAINAFKKVFKENLKFNKYQVNKDERLYNLVINYNKNKWKDHLNSVEKNMGDCRKTG
jgi:hypothetical protein